jgi:hypothetical protein
VYSVEEPTLLFDWYWLKSLALSLFSLPLCIAGRGLLMSADMRLMSLKLAHFTGTSYSYAAQDGGYGWVVVAASFFVNMIADGVGFSFGVMFDEFERDFDSSKVRKQLSRARSCCLENTPLRVATHTGYILAILL